MTIPSTQPKLLPDPTPAGLNVLIIEDHVDRAESTATVLRLFGPSVEIARDGPAGLEMARTNPPDVVLLDLKLPGMSGYDVAKQLTRLRPRFIPLLIAISGYAHDSRMKSEQTGIDFHMIKPIDPDELQTTLVRFQQLIRNSLTA